jgi:hypothetical protein
MGFLCFFSFVRVICYFRMWDEIFLGSLHKTHTEGQQLLHFPGFVCPSSRRRSIWITTFLLGYVSFSGYDDDDPFFSFTFPASFSRLLSFSVSLFPYASASCYGYIVSSSPYALMIFYSVILKEISCISRLEYQFFHSLPSLIPLLVFFLRLEYRSQIWVETLKLRQQKVKTRKKEDGSRSSSWRLWGWKSRPAMTTPKLPRCISIYIFWSNMLQEMEIWMEGKRDFSYSIWLFQFDLLYSSRV